MYLYVLACHDSNVTYSNGHYFKHILDTINYADIFQNHALLKTWARRCKEI